MEGDNQV